MTVCAAGYVNHSELHKPQGETDIESKGTTSAVAQVILLHLPDLHQTQKGLPSCLWSFNSPSSQGDKAPEGCVFSWILLKNKVGRQVADVGGDGNIHQVSASYWVQTFGKEGRQGGHWELPAFFNTSSERFCLSCFYRITQRMREKRKRHWLERH